MDSDLPIGRPQHIPVRRRSPVDRPGGRPSRPRPALDATSSGSGSARSARPPPGWSAASRPGSTTIPTATTSTWRRPPRSLGLSYSQGASSAFAKAFGRCMMFGLAHQRSDGYAVRRMLPDVARRHLSRMPDELQQRARTLARGAARPPPRGAATGSFARRGDARCRRRRRADRAAARRRRDPADTTAAEPC